MINIIRLRSFFTVVLFSIINFYCFSQNSTNPLLEKSYVKWVYQIPTTVSKLNKDNFSQKLVDFVLGENSIEINKPVAVLRWGDQSLLFLDQGNQNLLLYNTKKDDLDYLPNLNTSNYPSLIGACFSFGSNILFTDSKLNKVFTYNLENQNITELNDNYILDQPTGIAYSKINKEIWVVETHSHKISVFDNLGNLQREIGERGTEPGQFNFPTNIWIDEQGTVYVVDALNFRLQVFNQDGKLLSVFGEKGNASGYFARPKGVATDSFGNIYIVDALFHTVQIFDKSGNFLYNFGNQGRGKGEFWLPTGIFIDKEDFIYVADSYNSRIQVFQLVCNE